MLFPRKSLLGLGVFAIASLAAQAAQAHAVAGDRVFVNTLLIDDPGVGDEASLPIYSVTSPDGKSTVTDLNFEYDKTITSSLGAYLTRTTGADKNPWVAGGAAFGSITALTTLGSTANTATSGMKARATTLGQAQFSIQYPTQGVNGWLGGAVLISGKVGGSSIVTKVSAIE